MIIFLLLILIIIVSIFVLYNKKSINIEENAKENFWKFFIILNIGIICFFRFIWPGPSHYAGVTTMSIVLLIVNIVSIIILFSKKIIKNKPIIICIIGLNFLFTIGFPVYKLEEHEHVFHENQEQIINYIDYYNAYGIKLHRDYK